MLQKVQKDRKVPAPQANQNGQKVWDHQVVQDRFQAAQDHSQAVQEYPQAAQEHPQAAQEHPQAVQNIQVLQAGQKAVLHRKELDRAHQKKVLTAGESPEVHLTELKLIT